MSKNEGTAGKKVSRYYRRKWVYDLYRAKNKDKIRTKWETSRNNRLFGIEALSVDIVEMLGGICVDCGKTNEQQKKEINRNLSIHHKDGVGRNSPCPNNSRGNLCVLCHSCHMKRHRVFCKSPRTNKREE